MSTHNVQVEMQRAAVAATNVFDLGPTQLKTDHIDESTATHGVNIEGVTCKDGGVTSSVIGGTGFLTGSTGNYVTGTGGDFVTGGGGDFVCGLLGHFYPDDGTATATGGAATLAKGAGIITSEALSTAAGATYTLTITNSQVAATDLVFASVCNGTSTAGMPCITTITPASTSIVIVVQNIHSANAFNGTIKIAFLVMKA